MVFEWMDKDLLQLPLGPFRSGSELSRIEAWTVLEPLAVFDSLEGVHTDVNPNNVLLSGGMVYGPSPVVKLRGLGDCTVHSLILARGIGIFHGSDIDSSLVMDACPMLGTRYQGVVIRAPEAWKDIPITPKAEFWSLGVTLAHWLVGKTIFNLADKIVVGLTDQWCIAKLMRLDIIDGFALAECFEKGTFVHPNSGLEGAFIKVGSIRQELEKVDGPIEQGCIEFIESLLVVDPMRRPSAMEALQHPWLKRSSEYDSDW